MDSEDFDDLVCSDSGNESDDVELVPVAPEANNSSGSSDRMDIEDSPHDVLTTEQVVQYMVDCIREVNNVVEVRVKSMVGKV